jgi:hypothetical protein
MRRRSGMKFGEREFQAYLEALGVKFQYILVCFEIKLKGMV